MFDWTRRVQQLPRAVQPVRHPDRQPRCSARTPATSSGPSPTPAAPTRSRARSPGEPFDEDGARRAERRRPVAGPARRPARPAARQHPRRRPRRRRRARTCTARATACRSSGSSSTVDGRRHGPAQSSRGRHSARAHRRAPDLVDLRRDATSRRARRRSTGSLITRSSTTPARRPTPATTSCPLRRRRHRRRRPPRRRRDVAFTSAGVVARRGARTCNLATVEGTGHQRPGASPTPDTAVYVTARSSSSHREGVKAVNRRRRRHTDRRPVVSPSGTPLTFTYTCGRPASSPLTVVAVTDDNGTPTRWPTTSPPPVLVRASTSATSTATACSTRASCGATSRPAPLASLAQALRQHRRRPGGTDGRTTLFAADPAWVAAPTGIRIEKFVNGVDAARRAEDAHRARSASRPVRVDLRGATTGAALRSRTSSCVDDDGAGTPPVHAGVRRAATPTATACSTSARCGASRRPADRRTRSGRPVRQRCHGHRDADRDDGSPIRRADVASVTGTPTARRREGRQRRRPGAPDVLRGRRHRDGPVPRRSARPSPSPTGSSSSASRRSPT